MGFYFIVALVRMEQATTDALLLEFIGKAKKKTKLHRRIQKPEEKNKNKKSPCAPPPIIRTNIHSVDITAHSYTHTHTHIHSHAAESKKANENVQVSSNKYKLYVYQAHNEIAKAYTNTEIARQSDRVYCTHISVLCRI